MVQFPKGSPSQLPELMAAPVDKAKVSFGVDDETVGDAGSKKVPFTSLEGFIDARNLGPDGMNPTVEVVNITALAALDTSLFSTGDRITMRGHTTADDGGGGPWRLDEASVLIPNDGTVVAADGGGNWLRIVENGAQLLVSWWGTKGDTDGTVGDGTDDRAAILNAIAAAEQLITDGAGKVYLKFPFSDFGVGYRVTDSLSIGISIIPLMEIPVILDDGQSSGHNKIGLTVGVAGLVNPRMSGAHILMTRPTSDFSDWTDEGSIGVRLINTDASDVFVSSGDNGGFTIGLQLLGHATSTTARGCARNLFTLGEMANNKIAVQFANQSDSSGLGFSNQNTVRGGRFSHGNGVNINKDMVGVQFKSLDGNNKNINGNTVEYVDFELNQPEAGTGEMLPVEVVNGNENRVVNCRNEGNGANFARVHNDDDTSNSHNVFAWNAEAATIDDQSKDASSVALYLGEAEKQSPMRLVFDSGAMHRTAGFYDGATNTHIPDMHFVLSTSPVARVFATSIIWHVEETFTVVTGTDAELLVDADNTRVNGDVVYLTTSAADLPAPLAIATAYYVVNRVAGGFELSATFGGAPITMSDDGTGTHTYHSRERYVELVSTRSVGRFVSTSIVKQFVIDRDVEVGSEGRLAVMCFDTDGLQLLNQDDFTVDTGTEEIIPAAGTRAHSIVVDDPITFSNSGGGLPTGLVASTVYYCISITATRFIVSATKGGSAVDISTAGTGTHTYHLENWYCKGQNLVWNNSYADGSYRDGADTGADHPITIRPEVKHINVLCTGSATPGRIRRMRIYAVGVDTSPDTWIGYEQGGAGRHIGTSAPSAGVYLGVGTTVWDHTPAAAAAMGWMLVTAGPNGGTFKTLPVLGA